MGKATPHLTFFVCLSVCIAAGGTAPAYGRQADHQTGGTGGREANEQFAHAVRLHAAGDYEAAAREYREILKQHPGMVQAHSNLGAALAALGRYDEAITEYKQALKAMAGNRDVRLNLALAYYKSGRIAEATPGFQDLYRANPDDLRVALLLADCHYRSGDNKKVIEIVAPLAERHKDDLGLAYLLGMALLGEKRVNEGQVQIDRILRNGDSAEAKLMVGTMQLAVNELAAGRDTLAEGVKLNPRLAGIWAAYADALLATGDEDSALKAYLRELENDPNNFTANLHAGSLVKADRRYDEALRYLQRALTLRPGDAGARFEIASVYAGMSRYEEARQILEALVAEAPQFTEAHVTLATVYYRLKRKEDGDRERAIIQKLKADEQARELASQPKPDNGSSSRNGVEGAAPKPDIGKP